MLDLIELVFSRLKFSALRVCCYLDVKTNLKSYKPIIESFSLTETVNNIIKEFKAYLRLEERASIRTVYTDVDFSNCKILGDQLCIQRALLCLVNYIVEKAFNDKIRLIIGYDKPNELPKIII